MKLSSKRIADMVGLTIRTLRHYHQIGLLPEPERTSNGYRVYQLDHILQLLRIKRLTGLGMSLDQVATVLAQPDSSAAERMLVELDKNLGKQIKELREKRRTIQTIRKSGAPIDVLPDFAPYIEEVRQLGMQGQSLQADKLLIEIVTGIGGHKDVATLSHLLETVSSSSRAEAFSTLDQRLQEITTNTNPADSNQLAKDYATALLELQQEMHRTHTSFDWSDPSTIDEITGELMRSYLNTAQQQVLSHIAALYRAGIPDNTTAQLHA